MTSISHPKKKISSHQHDVPMYRRTSIAPINAKVSPTRIQISVPRAKSMRRDITDPEYYVLVFRVRATILTDIPLSPNLRRTSAPTDMPA